MRVLKEFEMLTTHWQRFFKVQCSTFEGQIADVAVIANLPHAFHSTLPVFFLLLSAWWALAPFSGIFEFQLPDVWKSLTELNILTSAFNEKYKLYAFFLNPALRWTPARRLVEQWTDLGNDLNIKKLYVGPCMDKDL
jgi:hypothetical protein